MTGRPTALEPGVPSNKGVSGEGIIAFTLNEAPQVCEAVNSQITFR